MNHKSEVSDDIDLGAIIITLWEGRRFICFLTVITTIASVVYSLSLPNIYQASAILAPVTSGAGGELSKYGGLAGLAGVALPTADDNTGLAVEVMKSKSFLRNFFVNRAVIVPLFAAERWDEVTGKLELDEQIYDQVDGRWLREYKPPKKSGEPTFQQAYKLFSQNFTVRRDPKTSLIIVSISHISPVVAKDWVNWMVEDINDVMRENDILVAEKSINYLTKEIASTPLAEVQRGLFRLIQSQTETIMLANASPQYVFKVVDPAIIEEEKFSPNRKLILIVGFMIGAVMACLIVLVKNGFVGYFKD